MTIKITRLTAYSNEELNRQIKILRPVWRFFKRSKYKNEYKAVLVKMEEI